VEYAQITSQFLNFHYEGNAGFKSLSQEDGPVKSETSAEWKADPAIGIVSGD
jgi:hypothetical protein